MCKNSWREFASGALSGECSWTAPTHHEQDRDTDVRAGLKHCLDCFGGSFSHDINCHSAFARAKHFLAVFKLVFSFLPPLLSGASGEFDQSSFILSKFL